MRKVPDTKDMRRCIMSKYKVVSEWGDKEYICTGPHNGQPCVCNSKCQYYRPQREVKHEKQTYN